MYVRHCGRAYTVMISLPAHSRPSCKQASKQAGNQVGGSFVRSPVSPCSVLFCSGLVSRSLRRLPACRLQHPLLPALHPSGFSRAAPQKGRVVCPPAAPSQALYTKHVVLAVVPDIKLHTWFRLGSTPGPRLGLALLRGRGKRGEARESWRWQWQAKKQHSTHTIRLPMQQARQASKQARQAAALAPIRRCRAPQPA